MNYNLLLGLEFYNQHQGEDKLQSNHRYILQDICQYIVQNMHMVF